MSTVKLRLSCLVAYERLKKSFSSFDPQTKQTKNTYYHGARLTLSTISGFELA